MDEGLIPSIYEIAIGFDTDKPVIRAYAIADTFDEALKGAKSFLDMNPWPAETPHVLSIKLLCNAEYIIVNRKYAPAHS